MARKRNVGFEKRPQFVVAEHNIVLVRAATKPCRGALSTKLSRAILDAISHRSFIATLATTLHGVPPPGPSGFGMKRLVSNEDLDRGVPPPASSGFGVKRWLASATLDRGEPPPLSSGFGIAKGFGFPALLSFDVSF